MKTTTTNWEEAVRIKNELLNEKDAEIKRLRAEVERIRRERDQWHERRDLAIVRAEEAEEREDKLEAKIEDLRELITECDGIECVKHDGLVRIAVKERKEADERAVRYGKALERLEWYGYRTHDLRQCLVCFALQRDGQHKPNCFIAQALIPTTAEQKETPHEQ